MPPAPGGRPKTCTGTDTSFTRDQAAKDAGLSKRQKDTALRLAAIPSAEFEAAVESENPREDYADVLPVRPFFKEFV
ncbi:hypothetical protein [Niveibacterium sp. SC-1]|uniref:hypothetical protein n=1 Tax=Niveibacterium sp. SC-1 TaxID=3135646 RepID=UPI00311E0F93